ncbi:Hypp2979 [Branchiostoma lanceolatum]|uniref:Hypp2979 protein n=1 Tax=Branchiostoma lanceolatum TaxID=7740 RepID=A0A8J9ZW16_BRALA|nr:Hypp2979 [Branchiostoma lanceolatum]
MATVMAVFLSRLSASGGRSYQGTTPENFTNLQACQGSCCGEKTDTGTDFAPQTQELRREKNPEPPTAQPAYPGNPTGAQTCRTTSNFSYQQSRGFRPSRKQKKKRQ